MKRSILISCAALLALSGAGLASAAEGGQSYTVAMTAEEEVPTPGPAGATGSVVLSLDPAAGQLCYSALTYDGPGTVEQGHIHTGAKGLAGPVAVNLGNVVVGKDACVTAPKDKLQAVMDDPAGHYVNLHTGTYPAGAVRGQLPAG